MSCLTTRAATLPLSGAHQERTDISKTTEKIHPDLTSFNIPWRRPAAASKIHGAGLCDPGWDRTLTVWGRMGACKP